MNNLKFIARYMALGAILTGVSAQANAQTCPITVSCPTGGTVESATFSDQWGEDFIPDTQTLLNAVSVDQFDKAFYANLHSVPETEVFLLGVEVSLTVKVTKMNWNLTALQTPCQFVWQWEPQVTLLANPGVATPEITHPPISQSDSVALTPPQEYHWDLLIDGDGVQEASECFGTTSNLAPWIGNGQVDWDIDFLSIPDQTGCGNAALQREIKGIVTVEVTYHYCYGSVIITEGCECNSPSPNYRRPGSLLLFPEFDTREGEYTVITVTNVDCIENSGQNINVEFVFIDENGCDEFNKTELLTPCDTLTFLAEELNPNPERGYLYAFAKEYTPGGGTNGDPISWNYLVGNEMIISGFSFFDYSMNPVVFQAIANDGVRTDRDLDGYRDLDGTEYEPAPNILTIPRYFGQDGVTGDPGIFNSQLILIGLTGGKRFDTTACLLYYNDNEEVFSADWTWRCWDKPYLLDINFGFGNGWLANNTDDDPFEIFGESGRESGWICIEGCAANSDQESIENPAIYAVLVEHVGNLGIADLPFECGIRTNGTLLPRGQFGDPDSDTDGDGDVDDNDAEDGDNQ